MLYFKSLLIRGLFEVRKHMDELIVLIQIMAQGVEGKACMPCVKNLQTLETEIRDRISGKFNTGADKGNEFAELVDRIVHSSLNNNTTKLYDFFQKNTNGIEP